MKAIFKSKSYWTISILATAIIFAAMFNFGRTYKAETSILISPKNPTAEKNISQILENASQISGTLFFYNEILKNNPELKDPVAGKTSSERKSYWNSLVKTKSVSGSGVIKLSILNDNPNEAERLSRTASLTLAQELSKYYNIKTELDAKIIDGPITSQGKKYNDGILLTASLIISLFSVYFSYAISDLLGKKGAEKKMFKLEPSKKKESSPKTKETPSDSPASEEAKKKLNELLKGRL